MSIASWFRRSRSKELPDEYRSSPGWTALWGILGRAGWVSAGDVWTEPTIVDMEKAYAHPVIKACVHEIITTASRPRIEIGSFTGNTWTALVKHPVLDLLENPNPEYSGAQLIQYVVSRMSLTGYGYVWKWRGAGGGKVSALWPIPTSWVKPVPASKGTGRLHSGYRIFGQKAIVPVEDVLVMRQIDPGSTDAGIGSMQACWHDYQLDVAREKYQAEMVENLKVPGLVATAEKGLSVQQSKDLKSDLEEMHGHGRRGKTAVLEGGVKLEVFNPLKDLDWPGISGLSEARICAAFRVPPILAHVRIGIQNATYSNYAQARESFYHETMAPLWDELGMSLTKELLIQEGYSGLQLRFRYDEFPEFQAKLMDQSRRAVLVYQSGLSTVNEGREACGLPPLDSPEGDERKPITAPPSFGGGGDGGTITSGGIDSKVKEIAV